MCQRDFGSQIGGVVELLSTIHHGISQRCSRQRGRQGAANFSCQGYGEGDSVNAKLRNFARFLVPDVQEKPARKAVEEARQRGLTKLGVKDMLTLRFSNMCITVPDSSKNLFLWRGE